MMRSRLHMRFLWFVAASASGQMVTIVPPLVAQDEPQPVAILGVLPVFQFDGFVTEWRSLPTMPSGNLHFSVAQVRAGIAVMVAAPDGELRSFRVRMAAAEPPRFPPIGWGNQFGFHELASADDCAPLIREDLEGCRTWYNKQVAYRRRIRPLFERAWRFQPGVESGAELLASAAFAELSPDQREQLEDIAPDSPEVVPSARFDLSPDRPGRTAEVLVPWSAFPPISEFELRQIRVDVIAGEGPLPTEPPARWNLGEPRSYGVTACGYGTSQVALFSADDVSFRWSSDSAQVLFIPKEGELLNRLVVLDNEAAGYQYEPDSTSVSPAAFVSEYSTVELGGGARLCGPFLAFQQDGLVSPVVAETHQAARSFDLRRAVVDFRHVEHRRTQEGDLLVKVGPRIYWSFYGSGQCGACPRSEFRVFRVDERTGEIHEAFSHTAVSDTGQDLEFDVAPDWRTITTFQAITDWSVEPVNTRWSAARHCYDHAEGLYVECGSEEDVPEPPKRLRLQAVWSR